MNLIQQQDALLNELNHKNSCSTTVFYCLGYLTTEKRL